MRFLLQVITFFCLIQGTAYSNLSIDPVKQSPYFSILTEGFTIDDFPLVSTEVRSNIAGPIADVEVRQTYRNDGTVPIEAIYVFPGSTKAAVYAMEMKIGDRTIRAKIREKSVARQQYKAAKKEGKRTSLLEQNKPNVFTMNVANILPGEQVDLVMRYNEFLVPESGQYSFVFPTVVGPRYSNGSDTPDFVNKTTYLSEKAIVPYDVDITVNIQSPVPIQKAKSPTHKLQIMNHSPKRLSAHLSYDEKSQGNKDFIFNYQLSDDEIVSGTLFYDHGDEKFFLSMIEPPSRVKEEMITPREFVFIVDVSGSMHGFPIEVTKTLMKELFKTMKDTDYFNVILFAGDSQRLSEIPLQANQKNVNKAMAILNQQRGGGGTELLRALKKAMASPKPFVNTSRSLVVVTDGYIHVEEDSFDYIREHLSEASVFSFGIGSSVNRYLIEGLAHVGRGESFVITEPQYAKAKATSFKQYIETPVLTNVSLCFDNFSAYDYIPRYIPDVLAERPIYVFGKYKGDVQGSITLHGHSGSGKYNYKMPLEKSSADQQNTAIRYLWAREKLKYLSDYESLSHNEKYKSQITQIGLDYNLLSKYTSFVAVDERQVTSGDQTKTVRQTLPLPKGVSNHAIGFEMEANAVLNNTDVPATEHLFVQLNKGLTQGQEGKIKEYIKKKFDTADQEAKDLLDGNSLTIEVDVEAKFISISDSNHSLDEEEIKILENHLYELTQLFESNITFKVVLIWL